MAAPPEITAPESLAVSYSGTPSLVEVQVSDAENNPVRVNWSVDSAPANGDLVIEPRNSSQQANISATVKGEYEVGVQAIDGIDST